MPDIGVDGRTVHIVAPRDFRQPSGQVVLLVHGAYDDHRYWQHLLMPLARAHTPIAVDLPGRGGTEGPPLDIATAYRRFFAALADALALPPSVFFGHSMGSSRARFSAVPMRRVPVAKTDAVIGPDARQLNP